jgi:hypothetical protein
MQFVDGGLDACGSFVMDIYKNRLDGKYLHMNGTVMDEFTILKSNLTVEIPDVSVCGQESVPITPTISGGSDNLHYVWSINNNTSTSVSINDQQIGNHQLTITDSLTGQVVTQNFNIVQGNNLTIVTQNDTLFAQGIANNYQWYLNGVDISGANGAFYIPQVAGSYSVSTFYGSCQSEGIFINPELNIPFIQAKGITLFPNPAHDVLTLEVNESFIGKTYQIYSSLGEIVKKGTLDSTNNLISLSKLSPGIYSIKINGLEENLRFVKK